MQQFFSNFALSPKWERFLARHQLTIFLIKRFNNMLTEQIASFLVEKTNFENDELETAIEGVITSAAALTKAGFDFEKAMADSEETPSESLNEVAKSIVGLASGISAQSMTPEKRAEIQGFFKSLFTSTTPALETAGEALFDATMQADAAIDAANALVATLLAGGE